MHSRLQRHLLIADVLHPVAPHWATVFKQKFSPYLQHRAARETADAVHLCNIPESPHDNTCSTFVDIAWPSLAKIERVPLAAKSFEDVAFWVREQLEAGILDDFILGQ